MRTLAVIPARYASRRFPGKPLVDIAGKPMIQWVYEATLQCAGFHDVIIATDDERIRAAAEAFGGRCVMTSPRHATGTDRVAEVAAGFPDARVVVNVQGDQPLVTPEAIWQLVAPFVAGGEGIAMSTVACPISGNGFADPNTVKVVCDRRMNALYFSRAPIPCFRDPGEAPVYHHMGLYAFEAAFLQQYASLPPTPLEQREQLEQLRALEHGHRIRVSLIDRAIPEVNTPGDVPAARAILAERGDG